MAKETLIIIKDDMDGSEGAETVTFSYQGTDYSIDLSEKNRAKMDKALAPFIEAGMRVGRSSSRRSGGAAPKSNAKEVRAWGKEQGYEVPDRGRIPVEVQEAYDAAH